MLKRSFPRILSLLFLVCIPSLAAAQLIGGDPSTHREYSGVCTWNWNCGGTLARMKWTSNGGTCWDNSLPQMPLVIILRGNGFSQADYDYLQHHLARNGMLSASIDVVANHPMVGLPTSTDHQETADEAEAYLTSDCFQEDFLDNFASAQPVDFHNTAIVGHSRGGETARYLADNFYGHPDFTTRAVVAMAPSEHV